MILTVNAEPVGTMAELRALIADIFPGQDARFGLLRDRKRVEITVELARRPSSEEFASTTARAVTARKITALGLYGRTLLPDSATLLGYTRRDRGVLVVEIVTQRDDESSLEPGELIVACNDREVINNGDLAVAIAEAPADRPLQLAVLDKDGGRRTLQVKPLQD